MVHWLNTVVRIFVVPHDSYKKMKQSHYRPGQALRAPGVYGYHISRQSTKEGVKFISPTHRPTLPPPLKKILVLIFVSWWVDSRATVLPEGLCQWKITITKSGIKPANFRHATHLEDSNKVFTTMSKFHECGTQSPNDWHLMNRTSAEGNEPHNLDFKLLLPTIRQKHLYKSDIYYYNRKI